MLLARLSLQDTCWLLIAVLGYKYPARPVYVQHLQLFHRVRGPTCLYSTRTGTSRDNVQAGATFSNAACHLAWPSFQYPALSDTHPPSQLPITSSTPRHLLHTPAQPDPQATRHAVRNLWTPTLAPRCHHPCNSSWQPSFWISSKARIHLFSISCVCLTYFHRPFHSPSIVFLSESSHSLLS